MPKYGLLINTTPDGTRVVIETEMDGTIIANIVYDASTIDGIIRALSACRAGLTDDVPKTLEPNARLETVDQPYYDIKSLPDRTVLALRHPGYGWVAYAFDGEQTHRLGTQLQMAAPG